MIAFLKSLFRSNQYTGDMSRHRVHALKYEDMCF